MNYRMSYPLGLTLSAVILSVTPVFAAINMEYVSVGDTGNTAGLGSGSSRYGAVGYVFQIGKYEVTNSQYAEFLNAADPAGDNVNGIYNTNMGTSARGGISYSPGATSGIKYSIRTNMGDKPVNFVSWYDSARFTNWLGNGQGAGSTETGAYSLTGITGTILKNTGATVWLPSEDEWYKAAYYDPTPGASGDNYWLYPTQSDTVPTVATADSTGGVANPGPNVVNYGSGAAWNGLQANVTTVGSAAANNFYGTFDQGGNVWEWNDAVVNSSRGLRGGGFNTAESTLRAFSTDNLFLGGELANVGFRVASVPEPSSWVLTIIAGSFTLRRRTRESYQNRP